jgi:two-component system LytT family response regulator
MIRAVIVEDESLARRKVRDFLKQHADFEVVGESVGGAEAAAAVVRLQPHVIFLDIRIPDLDGFRVLESLAPELIPEVVFVTAHDEYAVKAFEVHALDYVLKPFTRRRFDAAVERVRQRLQNEAREPRTRFLEWLRQTSEAGRDPDRLVVKSNGRILFLPAIQIEWIEAQGDYAVVHAKENHLVRDTMHGLESRLNPRRFVRIHRSAIINLDFVGEMKPIWSGDYRVTLRSGTELTWSRAFRRKLDPGKHKR